MDRRILVVDDDASIRDMARLMLEKKGYAVATAEDGLAALDEIRKQRPDLIIADVLMPKMDGYALYKELKKNKITADIPVLIVTARGMMEDSFKVLGADGFISKPVLPEELLKEIEKILNLTNLRQQVLSEQSNHKKILFAGPDKFLLDGMSAQAQRIGYETQLVLTGSDAIARAVKFFPDMIFIDVQMADISSGEVVDVLRRLPQFETKPIIGYSYYTSEQLADTEVRRKVLGIEAASKQFLHCGGTYYMGRYNPELFLKTISDYLKRKKKSHESS
jgi:CheY-like chemotaxis protein